MKPLYQNPWPHPEHGVLDILKWKLGVGARESAVLPDAPASPARWRLLDPLEIATPPATSWRVVWLGHASFLLQGAGVSLLVDPMFSNYCSPLPMRGLRRLVPPPCQIADLPRITAVLLTHSHYDHLDLPTLRQLGCDIPLVIACGHASWLRRKGFKEVREVSWWQTVQPAPGVNVTATPAQHFTARTLRDRNQGHWCGWMIEGAHTKLWHAGDSGLCDGFREIGERFGPIDFGMIPIGAYQPRAIMQAMHMNPREAVTAFQLTRCLTAAAMHWGTFRLTDEPTGEPPVLLEQATRKAGLADNAFTTRVIGEPFAIPTSRSSD